MPGLENDNFCNEQKTKRVSKRKNAVLDALTTFSVRDRRRSVALFSSGEKGGPVVLKCSAAALQGAAVYLHPIQTTAAAAAVIHRSGLNSGGNVDVLNF